MSKALTSGLVLGTIILMDLLVGVEFDLFVPSFPELQRFFGISPFWTEALLSVNFIGYCCSLFVVGSLADRYGRKPIIIAGLVVFIIGSVLCLGIKVYAVLLIGRFFQGVGIAAPSILSFLIIADSYPLKEQRFLLGLLNGLMNFATGVAPVVGSYIALGFHWQGNFITLLFLGGITLGMVAMFIPVTKSAPAHETGSLQGYLDIIRSRPLRRVIVHFIFQFVPYWIFVGMSPLLYMTDLGVPLAHFGCYQGALASLFAIGSLLSCSIINIYSQRTLLYVSLQIFCISLVSVGWVTFSESTIPLLITLAFFPFVIGQIIPSIILYPLVLNLNPQAKGKISSLIQGGRLILSAICLEGAGYVYQGSFYNIGLVILVLIVLTIATLYFALTDPVLKHAYESSKEGD